jgi:hypothetical protein
MSIIYLLELENSKFFLLSHKEPIINVSQFFLESILKYDYLKMNKPVKILDQYHGKHFLDFDLYVKKQMLIVGIDNVRGGSYSSPVLDDHQIAVLNKELFPEKYSSSECSDEVIKEILDNYGSIKITEIPAKRIQLKTNYSKYQKEKQAFESIQIDIPLCRKRLDWISRKCQEQTTSQKNTVLYRIINQEDIKIYREEILPVFDKIYKTFLTIYEKSLEKYQVVLIQNPKLVFDDFIYHGHKTHLRVSIENVEKIISAYSFFLTCIENRRTELEFDIFSWGDNAEQIFPRAIYLLDIMKDSFHSQNP